MRRISQEKFVKQLIVVIKMCICILIALVVYVELDSYLFCLEVRALTAALC